MLLSNPGRTRVLKSSQPSLKFLFSLLEITFRQFETCLWILFLEGSGNILKSFFVMTKAQECSFPRQQAKKAVFESSSPFWASSRVMVSGLRCSYAELLIRISLWSDSSSFSLFLSFSFIKFFSSLDCPAANSLAWSFEMSFINSFSLFWSLKSISWGMLTLESSKLSRNDLALALSR